MRVLLAEDEHSLGTWLCKALERSGIRVDWVDSGDMADMALRSHDHDALILDLGLPVMDGLSVLERLRARDRRLPAIVLTARSGLAEKIRLLNAGADDFLAKPFEFAELEARLHALVRRARGTDFPRFACGPLAFDVAGKLFTLGEQSLALSPREQAVLRVLIQHSGQPMSKQQILERVFSDEVEVQPEAVEVLVHRLRRRLDGCGVRIVTLRGLGYVLEEG